MKRILLVLGAILFLLGLAVVPQTNVYAAADATCSSDPSSGPVGTTFVLTCWGYTPNSYVYAYMVEPTGVATSLWSASGAIKVDENGSITYEQPTKFGNDFALQVGTWGFVAEELGLAKTVLHRGETWFTITGGTEDVGGAVLTASPSTVHKPEKAYSHLEFIGLNLLTTEPGETSVLSGSGFMPGEVVSFWVEPAGGGCPSMTQHNSVNAGLVVPTVGGLFINADINQPIYDGVGSQAFGDIKADAGGNVSAQVAFYVYACEGPWRFVARGNTSGYGAETWITVIGNTVATDAWLSADPTSASAMYGVVNFSGSGFGANEHITCWITSPQGRTIGYPEEYYLTYSLPGIYQRDRAIMSNASGEINFSLVTGSYYEKSNITLIVGGVSQSAQDTFLNPIQSEGALGEYAMSCRGDSTGSTAITHYTLTGGFVDP